MKKEAKLILGGGAAYGLAHIGAIKAIQEEFTITGIVGTSMGAIVGALVAMGKPPEEILEIALDNRSASIFNPLSVPLLPSAFSSALFNGLHSGKAIYNKFQLWTDNTNIEDLKMPYMAVAYDLNRHTTVLIDRGSLAMAMRASSSLPLIFKPHTAGRYLFVDGGVEHPLPIAFGERVPGKYTIAVNVLPPVSLEAERIDLGFPAHRKRMWPHQVFIQSLLQNQGFVAIQAMLQNPPDLIIDAYNPQKKIYDLFNVQDFFDHGYKAAKESIEKHIEPSFREQLQETNRSLISKFTKN